MKNYAGPAEIMYHTGLSAGMIRGAKYALLPGDPGRVEEMCIRDSYDASRSPLLVTPFPPIVILNGGEGSITVMRKTVRCYSG